MIASACWLGMVLVAVVPPPPSSRGAADLLRQQHEAIGRDEAGKLQTLADRLRGEGRAAASREVLKLIPPAAPADGPTRLVPLPEIVRPPSVPPAPNPPNASGPADERWRAELSAIREASARAYFDLAGRAASGTDRNFALADACLRAVLERQPNHAEARRLMGYVPFEEGWATPYAVAQTRAGKVDHPTFGWVDKEWVPRLERGELPAPVVRGQRQVRWLPAAEADALHSPWESRWRISTEHFQIQTNVPLSEAIAFGRQLERFHELFFALLGDLLVTTDVRLPLAQRFQDKKMTGERKADPHQVYYFKDKQEYVDYLTPLTGPKIAGSLGIYIPPKPGRIKRAPAYFFRDQGGQLEASATLFHEVSHQLLFETAGPNNYERNAGNYWVFEGLGTYFETVEAGPDGSLSVGALVGPRIREAQVQLLERNAFIPIERFVRLGKGTFNEDSAVILHYQESMALAVFLMQAQGGRYREPFLDYVKDAYRGRLKRDTGRSLEDRLDVPYATLDTQFLQFLKGP
jgi:hypothetical protein